MSDASNKALWPTFLAVIGVFAIFLLILRVAQTPVQPLDAPANVPPEEQWKMSDQGRQTRLAEFRGREAAALQGYGWVDQQNGVVRLPLERAIELTIAESQQPAGAARR
jgi:hypothetical protein